MTCPDKVTKLYRVALLLQQGDRGQGTASSGRIMIITGGEKVGETLGKMIGGWMDGQANFRFMPI